LEVSSYAPAKDYLSAIAASPVSASDRVSEAWRRKLCEWCYEVVDHFNFDREAVSIALNYLDRAVAVRTSSSDEVIPKREFQLLAVTCLYIAIKLHGESDSSAPPKKLRIDAFVELSRGYFQVEIIETMERTILESLDWHLNPPTMLRFVASLMSLCPKWSSADQRPAYQNVLSGIYEVARYLSELSVCVSTFTFNHKASVIAYASILCAVEALQRTLPLPFQVRVAFLRNLSDVTGLYPELDEVSLLRDMLRELCPSMFENDEIPPEFLIDRTSMIQLDDEDGGKSSPVCVVDNATSHTRRKRSRPYGNDDVRPSRSPTQ
jgi:lipoyl(octanoyl) transferase